jgi:hypothetical protein
MALPVFQAGPPKKGPAKAAGKGIKVKRKAKAK